MNEKQQILDASNQDFYKKIIENAPMGYAYHKLIMNDKGEPCDYEFIEVNKAFEKAIGMDRKSIIGKKASEIFPTIQQGSFDWIGFYSEIALKGCQREIEQFFPPLNKWFRVNAYSPQQGYFITLSVDITERTKNDQEKIQQAGLITSLLDSIPDIVFFKDTEGVFLGCNANHESFLGKKKSEIIGHTDYEFHSPENASFYRQKDNEMLNKLEPTRNEEWVTYPDGKKVLLDTLKTPYWGEDGSLIGILGISRDITLRKEAEEKLRESEVNFRTFFETMDDMIFVANNEGVIFYTNGAVTRKLGYAQNEL